jgi:hypothetical protein
MDESLRRRVRRRAGNRCEYCLLRQEHESFSPFHIEHVIATQHGGTNGPDNLALACAWCNLVKGPNISSVDPVSGKLTRLYHPRKDVWKAHFHRVGPRVEGKTPIGRATVHLLRMNEPDTVDLRRLLIQLGEL